MKWATFILGMTLFTNLALTQNQFEGSTNISPDTERDRINQLREDSKQKTDSLSRIAEKDQETLEINSLYYYETGYARFYQGYYGDSQTLIINDTEFRLNDWTLSFFPTQAGTYRVPHFEIHSLKVVALKLSFSESGTKILDCHSDFYQKLETSGCELPATINPSSLTVTIEAITQTGIAYHLSLGLSPGLNETYVGTFDLKQLTDMKISHFPYRVGLINDKDWFTFIAPMNDRFQMILTFKDQKVLINIANHEPLPNYSYIPAIKEEAPVIPKGYPYRVEVFSPRKTFDLSIRIFVEAGVKFFSGNESSLQNATMFPLAEIRLATFAVSFPYVMGFFSFEQSLQNVLSDSQLTNLSGYDLQARIQYQFKALWSRPTPYLGAGLFELNIQDLQFKGDFLPRVSGAGITVGVDTTFFEKFHFKPAVFIPFIIDQITVTQYLRPEIGVSYSFTDHLAIEARWKGGFYNRDPEGGVAARAGSMHHLGMYFSYNL
jgi:hypothetical protein